MKETLPPGQQGTPERHKLGHKELPTTQQARKITTISNQYHTRAQVSLHSRQDGRDAGFNGNPAKFSAEIGRKMLKLKILAVMKQIRHLRRKAGKSVSGNMASLQAD